MAKNYFDRYVWLIDTINRYGHVSKKEIDELWSRSPLNEKNDREIAERTFHNHREAILDTFGIEIKCDRALGYYIANSGELEADGIRQWLLESLSMNNMLRESEGMRERILFEKIPSSRKWLPVIVNAMRDGKAIEMKYQTFWRNEPNVYVTHPWCLKLFKQRWYMLAKSEGKDEPRIYALDERLIDAVQTKKALEVPAGFNAEAFFSNYFGIIVGNGCEPSEVDIRVDAAQVKYVKTLPLHASQTMVEETPEYTVFRYRLVPTLDFRQEILSRGAAFEVLAPQWFRDEIGEELARMCRKYGR